MVFLSSDLHIKERKHLMHLLWTECRENQKQNMKLCNDKVIHETIPQHDTAPLVPIFFIFMQFSGIIAE